MEQQEIKKLQFNKSRDREADHQGPPELLLVILLLSSVATSNSPATLAPPPQNPPCKTHRSIVYPVVGLLHVACCSCWHLPLSVYASI